MVRRPQAWGPELPEDPIEVTQASRSRSRWQQGLLIMVQRPQAWGPELPEDPIEATQAIRSRSRSIIPGRRTVLASCSRSRSTSIGRRTVLASRSRSRSRGEKDSPVERHEHFPTQGYGIGDGNYEAYGKSNTGSTAAQSDRRLIPPSDLQPGMCRCSMRCYHPMERGHEPYCLYCDPRHCPEGCCCPCAMCYPDTDSTRPQDLLPTGGLILHTSSSPAATSPTQMVGHPEYGTDGIWIEPDFAKRLPPQGFAKRFERARVAARLVHLRSDWRMWSWCPDDSEEDEASLPLHRFHHPPPAPPRASKPKPAFQPRVVLILVPEKLGRFRVSYNALPGRGEAEMPGLPVPFGPPRVWAPPVVSTTSDTRATTSGEDASGGQHGLEQLPLPVRSPLGKHAGQALLQVLHQAEGSPLHK